jgi:DNA end-binding protein Ku
MAHPRKQPAASHRQAGKARASWRGMLRFGLVSIPVEAFNAHSIDAEQISLHQLHAKCHSRIHYQKVCPIHGPVPNDEIVSGYEVGKGKYIEISPDELDKLRSAAERALTVDAFITPDEIDPIHFDGRMYYLSPDGDSAREPYTVFLEALRREGRWGIGQVVFSGKEQLVVVRPYREALLMAMLAYQAEIRDPGNTIVPPLHVSGSDRMVKLAEQLIENWTDESFDFSKYEDTHFKGMQALIQAKLEGREVVAPEAEETPEVINLMDALKKSIAKGGHERARQAATASRSKRESGRKKGRRAS